MSRQELPAEGGRDHVPAGQQGIDSGRGSQETGFLPVNLASLCIDTITGFSLYLRSARSGQMVLYRAGDLPFTEFHRDRLRGNGVEEAFIAAADRKPYLRYLEEHLNEVLHSEALPPAQRAKLLYSCASLMIEDLLADPSLGVDVSRAHAFVDSTVDYLFRRAEHFTDLLEIMSFDYSTYTHSVNVCIFGVALGRRLGYGQSDLNRLGAGLLLHDAGKATIDPAILAKRGELSPEEWEIIKTHPARGVELLTRSEGVEPDSLQVVRQHHEKCSGKGYPDGLCEGQIHSFAKIGAVADVFDALTTERPYKRAVASFPAIRIMQREMADAFDRTMLREMILLLHRTQGRADGDAGPAGTGHRDAAA